MIRAIIIAVVVGCVSTPQPAGAYSVLAHEANIDAVWDATIVPMLLARYPGTTPEQLLEARSYAYGGCVIQDLGYYPFGSHFFSNLLHYVRTGDFIDALIRDSQDVNDYAFALGALGHYAADNDGHRLAVNLAVPIMYPKLKARYGKSVTYAQENSTMTSLPACRQACARYCWPITATARRHRPSIASWRCSAGNKRLTPADRIARRRP